MSDANEGRKCLKGCVHLPIIITAAHLNSEAMLCRYSEKRSKGTSVVPSSSIL